jgi:hypothetical protein
MPRLTLDISMSLDGFVAGPNASLEQPLGAGGRPVPQVGLPARGLARAPRPEFTFFTDGIEAALEEARAEAGDKDVAVAGGADIAQQYVRAGLLDLGGEPIQLECTRVIDSPAVTHLKYRVVK